jgi:hypothetical protein
MTLLSKQRFIACLVVILLANWICVSPGSLNAQTQGNNAVFSGTPTSPTVVGSSAYIDANAVIRTDSKTDICAKINAALGLITTSSSNVIDARGVTNLVCPVSDTPWQYPTTGTAITTPATILLPAGTILINTGWTLPSGTRIIGEGAGYNASVTTGTTGVTTIQVCKSGVTGCSGSFSGTMISMGSVTLTNFCPSNICNGISIENLWLDGQNLSGVNGILNSYSQEQSYVKHVTLYQILGNGLGVSLPTSGSGSPQNSGPYSDIKFWIPSSSAPTSSTVCARIYKVSTRGIHGLNCLNSSATNGVSAVSLDGPGNSLEDIVVQGFQYGVRIGASSAAQNNVLINVSGGPNVTSVVLISNAQPVSDLSLLGIGNGTIGSVTGATDTITDNRTSPVTTLSDATVAMYALGETVTIGGGNIAYSRFTTSPNVPTWAHGSGSPTNSAACNIGSLYSNVSGGSGSTWWVCLPASKSPCTTTSCWADIN